MLSSWWRSTSGSVSEGSLRRTCAKAASAVVGYASWSSQEAGSHSLERMKAFDPAGEV